MKVGEKFKSKDSDLIVKVISIESRKHFIGEVITPNFVPETDYYNIPEGYEGEFESKYFEKVEVEKEVIKRISIKDIELDVDYLIIFVNDCSNPIPTIQTGEELIYYLTEILETHFDTVPKRSKWDSELLEIGYHIFKL